MNNRWKRQNETTNICIGREMNRDRDNIVAEVYKNKKNKKETKTSKQKWKKKER